MHKQGVEGSHGQSLYYWYPQSVGWGYPALSPTVLALLQHEEEYYCLSILDHCGIAA